MDRHPALCRAAAPYAAQLCVHAGGLYAADGGLALGERSRGRVRYRRGAGRGDLPGHPVREHHRLDHLPRQGSHGARPEIRPVAGRRRAVGHRYALGPSGREGVAPSQPPSPGRRHPRARPTDQPSLLRRRERRAREARAGVAWPHDDAAARAVVAGLRGGCLAPARRRHSATSVAQYGAGVGVDQRGRAGAAAGVAAIPGCAHRRRRPGARQCRA